MSIEPAKVSRILVVKSSTHLWQLLKDRDEDWCDTAEIIVFMYSVEKLINGCDCDRDENTDGVNSDYIVIKNSSVCQSKLQSIFGCSRIVFES